MSIDQVSKPRSAKYCIADEFTRPGTSRSKVGCDAIEEPCTNRIVPFFGPPGARFSHRNSLAGPLLVQCSCPLISCPLLALWPLTSFMTGSYELLRNARPRMTSQSWAALDVRGFKVED